MSLYKDFADNVTDALENCPIDKEEFVGGILLMADENGQYVVTTEDDSESVITLLKTAIKVIENTFNEIPDKKN